MTPPLVKAAWDHPPTALGFKRLVIRRSFSLVGLGALLVVTLAGAMLELIPHGALIFICLAATTLPFLPVLLVAYVRRHRVAAILRAYPWCEVSGHHPPRTPSIIAIRVAEDCAPTFRMFPFPIQVTDSENLIWFAGDPRFGGVVSPVGGHRPVRVVLDKGAGREWGGGDDALALRVGLVRRSGKATQT
ncbi:hypothetical protein [Streptomyces goshikiensis]|uniref:hypothetical protein n=1 Tax=Streptomyces goshikiensis TaxID=1942 RepID=UPI00367DD5B1